MSELNLKAEQNIESVEDFKFEQEPIKGQPELRWRGKRPFTSTQFYPAKLKETYGYCDPSVKQIVISNMSELASKVDAWADLDEYRNIGLRHEIIHAMFYESGLAEQCEYATNEELIDWIAIQFEKIEEAYRQADCL